MCLSLLLPIVVYLQTLLSIEQSQSITAIKTDQIQKFPAHRDIHKFDKFGECVHNSGGSLLFLKRFFLLQSILRIFIDIRFKSAQKQ